MSRRERIYKQSQLKNNTTGTSIEEYQEYINPCEEFEYWKAGSVIGSRDASDEVLLTLVEHHTIDTHPE